ncbi:MAG: hypothetical protein KF716_16035 [Anaerolineae bacterium]|nr:hypothetical protein [Anaerolineae bacterium]
MMIKVFGVGDGGIHALAKMRSELDRGVAYFAVNTEATSLTETRATALQLGRTPMYHFGTGGDPEVGKRAAEECTDDLRAAMLGASKVLIAGGFGGGTATGAAAVIADIAQRMGLPAIVVATLPFSFEGQVRAQIAQRGVETLRQLEIASVIIRLDQLTPFVDSQPALNRLYAMADAALAWHVLTQCMA